MKEFIEENNLLPDHVCLDTDDIGLNWWDYEGNDHENKYQSDCFAKAVELSGHKDLFFVTARLKARPAKLICDFVKKCR